jgi:hypothetical protein
MGCLFLRLRIWGSEQSAQRQNTCQKKAVLHSWKILRLSFYQMAEPWQMKNASGKLAALHLG